MDDEDFYDDNGESEQSQSESRYIHSLNGIEKAGIRDGKSKFEEETRQQGFDEGLALGINLGELAGRVFGLARQAHKTDPIGITEQLVEGLGQALLQSLAEMSSCHKPAALTTANETISVFPGPVQDAYRLYVDNLNLHREHHSHEH
ncbi:hypothetical protein EON65_34965 [archaeon]|nr:MAG: hypothetical protein EON65_34965 [archaeon]